MNEKSRLQRIKISHSLFSKQIPRTTYELSLNRKRFKTKALMMTRKEAAREVEEEWEGTGDMGGIMAVWGIKREGRAIANTSFWARRLMACFRLWASFLSVSCRLALKASSAVRASSRRVFWRPRIGR